MNDKLEKRLMKLFPFMAQRSVWDGERENRPVYCQCGDGWYPLIYELCFDIQTLYNREEKDSSNLIVEEVKEKYGGLRFYVSGYIDGVLEIIDKYEALSLETCEDCGSKGTVITKNGWTMVRCEKCKEKSNPVW